MFKSNLFLKSTCSLLLYRNYRDPVNKDSPKIDLMVNDYWGQSGEPTRHILSQSHLFWYPLLQRPQWRI